MARRTKSERDEAKRQAVLDEATRLAALLSSAVGADPLSPPPFVADPRLAPALAVWRELAPQLAASGRLHMLDRSLFAALCYWHAEYITAVDDILDRGYSFMAKATAGGERPWTNPSVERRDTAWSEILTLSAKFGLTPLDRVAFNRARKNGEDDDAEARLPLTQPVVQGGEAVETPPDRWGQLLDGPRH